MNIQDIAKAIRFIVRTEKGVIVVSDKAAAETLSEVFLEAGEGGPFTGPFLENESTLKVWYVDTD